MKVPTAVRSLISINSPKVKMESSQVSIKSQPHIHIHMGSVLKIGLKVPTSNHRERAAPVNVVSHP